MSEEDVGELKETFDHFDRDKNGRIDFGEFRELMDALDAGMRDAEARIGFDAIDVDGNGFVEFDEFRRWWSER